MTWRDDPKSNRPPKLEPTKAVTSDVTLESDSSQSQIYSVARHCGIGHAVACFSRACLIRLIDFPQMPLRLATGEVIKSGRSALLVRVELPVGGRMTSVAYKCVRRRTWLKKMTVLVRTNRTLRTWRIGHELLRRGIATARPLAVIVPHRFDFTNHSYVVHEWIERGLNLRDWCWWASELKPGQRHHVMRSAATSLGDLLGRMHSQHVSHRDLKPGNMLLVSAGRNVHSYVIDLDGVSIHKSLSQGLRLRNLSRLVVGLSELPRLDRTVHLRFLRAYLRAVGNGVDRWKGTWKSLEKTGEARLERKLRKAA